MLVSGGSIEALSGFERARARAGLHDAMPLGHLPPDKVIDFTMRLEACALVAADGVRAPYLAIMSRLVYNMKTNGATLVDTYPLTRLVTVSHRGLQIGTVRAQRDANVGTRLEQLFARAKAEADIASSMALSVSGDGAIRCPKCKTQEGITAVAAQMNAGDEGMKTRCICRCGHRWQLG